MEFATSIGQSLLGEVKKLQALLQEKEDRIKELENEKGDLERSIEAINRHLRAKEESEGKCDIMINMSLRTLCLS